MNYAGQQPPLQGMANQMAQYGRYGDSMLVHMNPVEVEGIAALSPTGKLTTNPVTGQPEAFLPFLAPILGTMLGKAFLPALATKVGLAGLGSNVAGAIGSGLATTAVTGDIKEGILSGITGYGLGQMIGGAADALDPRIAATEGALEKVSESAAQGAVDVAGKEAALQAVGQMPVTPSGAGSGVSDILAAGKDLGEAQRSLATLRGGEAALESSLSNLRGNISPMDTLTAPIREPGAFLKGAMDPKAILPIAVGEGTRGQMQMQERLKEDRRRLMGEGLEDEGRAIFNMQDAIARVRRDYGMQQGGITSIDPENFRQNMEGLYRLSGQQPVRMAAGGTPGSRQADIRPPTAVAPPEGYRPGFDPEFMYFQKAPPPPPAGGDGEIVIDDGPLPGGGVETDTGYTAPALTQDIIDRYTELATTQGNFHRQNDLSGRNIANREKYLSDFMSMRAMYPELAGLDNVLDIDPDYRQGGSESYNIDIAGNTFGNVSGAGTFSAPGGNSFGAVEGSRAAPTGPAGLPGGGIADLPGAAFVGGQGGQDPLVAALAIEDIQGPGRRGGSGGFAMTDGMLAQRYQEGGMTGAEPRPEMADTMESNGARLIEQTAAAIAGGMPEDQAEAIINRFIDEYGSEAFEMLRKRVLRDIVPDAQTEGRIKGQGGGMDDMIPGMIGTQQPVAVSPGEYIVPADVVSGLGDGDTDAGASELDGMLDRVRQARTGRRMQPQPLDKGKVMPA